MRTRTLLLATVVVACGDAGAGDDATPAELRVGKGEPQCPEGTRWADGECHPSQGEGEGEGEGPPAGEGGGPSQPPGEGEGQAAPCPAGQERVNGACTPAVDEPGAPQDDPSGQDIAPSGAPSGEGCACRGVEAPSTANAPWGALLRR